MTINILETLLRTEDCGEYAEKVNQTAQDLIQGGQYSDLRILIDFVRERHYFHVYKAVQHAYAELPCEEREKIRRVTGIEPAFEI